jgi:hypothetical protein
VVVTFNNTVFVWQSPCNREVGVTSSARNLFIWVKSRTSRNSNVPVFHILFLTTVYSHGVIFFIVAPYSFQITRQLAAHSSALPSPFPPASFNAAHTTERGICALLWQRKSLWFNRRPRNLFVMFGEISSVADISRAPVHESGNLASFVSLWGATRMLILWGEV